MDKIAQKAGRINKLLEKANDIWHGAPDEGTTTEGVPEGEESRLTNVLANLRDIDKKIREIAAPLKGYLKAANSNFNRKEYIAAIGYIGRFHDAIELIDGQLLKLNSGVDEEHIKFLIDNLDPEELKYVLEHLSPKMEKAIEKIKLHKFKPINKQGLVAPKAAQDNRVTLVKEAGIADWWHNVRTDRGKDLASWEKNFPQYTKELKKQISAMISKSEGYLSYLFGALKKLDGFRASRQIENYLKEAEKLKSKYNIFDSQFINFYTSHAKKLIDYKKIMDEKSLASKEESLLDKEQVATAPIINEKLPFPVNKNLTQLKTDWELPNKADMPDFNNPPPNLKNKYLSLETKNKLPVGTTNTFPPIILDKKNDVIPVPLDPHLEGPQLSPEQREMLKALPQEEQTKILKALNKKKPAKQKTTASYEDFMLKISSLRDSHPFVIAREIISFAENCDEETKIKLLNIAKNMV